MEVDDPTSNVVYLAASWLNIFLYTWELVLCHRYFKRPNRPFWYKIAVTGLVFFDTLCTLTICVNISILVLNLFSNGGSAPLAPTSISIVLTYCSAAIEQAILTHMFYSLSRNIFITSILALLVVGHIGLSIATAVIILVLDSVLNLAVTMTEASAIVCAATDISIAIALGHGVWKSLSPTDIIPARNSFARKFFLLCVSSGAIVASNTLVMMILLLHGGPAFSFFFFWQGRVYSLTLLANFLVGIHFRWENDTALIMTSGSQQDRRTSRITGVVFDPVYGSHTESGTSHHVTTPLGDADRKVAPTPCAPQPYNYNLEDELTQLERRHAQSVP
ncbi:hypothetical protein R3P38DRAFT_3338215 [Favolaschia claudopus]|uniref:DUF6534 domain-containing protein n=1 Tax=Favolaschia claudopus TaxID=2862362 RepID=A0AAV9YY80_9AGAR